MSKEKIVFEQPKILVADDDFFMRGQAKIAMQDFGEIIEAENGERALELYKEHRPVIMLLDIHMPQVGGHDVLRKVLKFDPNAYVIMFSADAVEKNVVEARFGGAKGFVVKPFTKQDLIKYVLACPGLQANPRSAKA